MWKDPNLVIKDSIAKANAWREFVGHFPKADRSRFIAQGSTDGKNVTEEIFFKEGLGSLQSVFGSDKKYWSEEMKKALGLDDQRSGGNWRVSLPAGAAWFKSFLAHPCRTFRRQSAKFEKNIRHPNPNIRHA